MKDQFDISGDFETTEFEIAQVACTTKYDVQEWTVLSHMPQEGRVLVASLRKLIYQCKLLLDICKASERTISILNCLRVAS